MKEYIDLEKANIDFLIDTIWMLDKQHKKLKEDYIAQSKTITELQIKVAKLTDLVNDLQSDIYFMREQ